LTKQRIAPLNPVAEVKREGNAAMPPVINNVMLQWGALFATEWPEPQHPTAKEYDLVVMKLAQKGYVTLDKGPNWITEKGRELADSIIRDAQQAAN
jgi:hypothetical protein